MIYRHKAKVYNSKNKIKPDKQTRKVGYELQLSAIMDGMTLAQSSIDFKEDINQCCQLLENKTQQQLSQTGSGSGNRYYWSQTHKHPVSRYNVCYLFLFIYIYF